MMITVELVLGLTQKGRALKIGLTKELRADSTALNLGLTLALTLNPVEKHGGDGDDVDDEGYVPLNRSGEKN